MTSQIMKQSTPVFIEVRGLRYHIRTWGEKTGRPIFMLHGWQDNSASFQYVVDHLKQDYYIIAPDWRGCGDSQWSDDGSYWFNDYLADLQVLLQHFQPGTPVDLVCHSMGFNIGSVYAGVFPHRVKRLVNLECHGFREVSPDDHPARYAEWLEAVAEKKAAPGYPSFDRIAEKLQAANPALRPGQSEYLARHLARMGEDGVVRMLNDPAQRSPTNKMLYVGLLRPEEAEACWKRVEAPVLWIEGGKSDVPRQIGATSEQRARRRSAFRSLDVKVIADAGHLVHVEYAEDVAAAIEEFLLI